MTNKLIVIVQHYKKKKKKTFLFKRRDFTIWLFQVSAEGFEVSWPFPYFQLSLVFLEKMPLNKRTRLTN